MKSKYKHIPECKTCNGICCRYLIVPVDDSMIEDINDYKRWLKYRGIEFFVFKGKPIIMIEKDCEYLDGNKCLLINKPERPEMCGTGDCPKYDRFYWNMIRSKFKTLK